jgi:hypothetical protein
MPVRRVRAWKEGRWISAADFALRLSSHVVFEESDCRCLAVGEAAGGRSMGYVELWRRPRSNGN